MFIDSCPGFFTVEHFCEIFDNSFIGCIVVDSESMQPVGVNQAICGMLGLSAPDILERKYAGDPNIQPVVEYMLNSVFPIARKYGHSGPTQIRHDVVETGETVFLKVQCFLTKNELIDQNLFILLVVDITEQKIALEKYQSKNLRILSSNAEKRTERRIREKLVRMNLTPMETEVCLRLRKNMTNKDIAADLGIADATVKTHRRNLRAKLELNGSRQSLYRFLIQL